MYPFKIIFLLALCGLFFIPSAAVSGQPPSYTVTTDQDTTDSEGCTPSHCTLREAIIASNNTPNFSEVIYIPDSIGSITLVNGQFDITDALSIVRTGSTQVNIRANDSSRHFEVATGVYLYLSGMGLYDGFADNGGAILNRGRVDLINMQITFNEASKAGNFGDGGAIYNTSTGILNLFNNTLIYSNRANFGGGIYNNGGTVIIRDSLIWGNSATGHEASNGGGIRNWQSGRVEIYNSTILRNSADAEGGGIRSVGTGSTLYVEDTWIDQNEAQFGGGLFNSGSAEIKRSLFEANMIGAFGNGNAINNSGTLNLTNSTLYGNIGGYSGGGLYNSGTATLVHVTIYNNGAASGGGIATTGGSATSFTHIFVGGSTSGSDCMFLGSSGYLANNGDTDGSCGSFSTYTNPRTAAFGSYGGATKVLTLNANSVLIDAGDVEHCAATDQRNFGRPVDGVDAGTVAECDLGAYEWGAVFTPTAVHLVTVNAAGTGNIYPIILFLFLITLIIPLHWIFDKRKGSSEH